jgi:hypothetical protein
MSKPQMKVSRTRTELETINRDLQGKCGSTYRLELSQYRHRDPKAVVYDESLSLNEYDIILCMYHENSCVSSVTGRYDQTQHSMEVLSKTDRQYEGLKYNLYLRAVFIYLMCFIRPTIQKIYSQATNPISTYTMYKHYHVTNRELQEYVQMHNLTPDTFTVEDAVKFHEYFVEKSKHNLVEAQEELDYNLELCSEEFGRECTVEDLGFETIEEALEYYNTISNYKPAPQLELNLTTPGVKEFMYHKLLSIPIKCVNPRVGGNPRKKSTRRHKSKQRHKSVRRNKTKNKK